MWIHHIIMLILVINLSVITQDSATISELVAFTGCYQGSVQLINGGSYYGIVAICIGGEWGTVCNSGWDNNDAAVVCRQLGYSPSGASTYSTIYNSYYGSGIQAIYMNNVNCRGTELSLFQCDYQSLIGDYSPCNHYYSDATVQCSTSSPCTYGQVRLTGGDVSTEGNVEICYGGQWNGICSTNFNYQDALVVCRQLGLPTSNVAVNSYRYAQYPIMPTYANGGFNCYGYESSITSCPTYCCASCDFSSRAGVSCRGVVVQTQTAPCSGQGVRLVNGSDVNEGRVEVCNNGVWGTVYGTSGGWNSVSGQVVCRQLGFQNPVAFIYIDNTFGLGTGQILIKNLNCNGNEASIWSCSIYSGYYFSTQNSAGLRCENYPLNQGCQAGSVRLTGGSTAQEGRIELCVQSSPGVTIWGSVCNVQSYGVAEVVCRGLNYLRSGAVVYTVTPFGPSQNPFVLDSPSCSGTESSLLSCSLPYSVGVHRCHRGQESGVTCQGLCVPGSVQLANSYTATEGRLEMCINGSWTTFYGVNSWDTYAPNIICRQMFGSTAYGTSQYYSPGYPPYNYYTSIYGIGTGSLVITQLSCQGTETRLMNCSYVISTGYTHSYDVGIRCYVNSSCTEGQVRLADGSSTYEGRVEVCRGGVWVAIYDSGWSYYAALVVCRQLGYPYQWAVPYGGSQFGKGTTLLDIFYIYCTGNEASIGQCSYSSIPRGTNYNSRNQIGVTLSSISNNSAGVTCLGPTTNVPECSSGDVQLADGPSTREGRLKICKRDGYWASVCVNGIDKTAALIVCKSIGINAAGVNISSGLHRTYTGPILGSISCIGSESNVGGCTIGNVGTLNCGHEKDAVISCLNDKVFYNITVTTNPATGPFSIGSTITLYCQSNPPLPSGVTYTWRAAIYSSVITNNNSQASNANVTIGLNHPTIGHYYCVVNNGASVLGVGKADIAVQSLITSSLNPTILFVPPQSIVLSVNVTEIYVTQFLRSLTWYFEGNPISAGGRVMLSPDSTTLTIMNTVESDAGVYEVKHMGVVTSSRQEKCEARVLSSLRQYPVLAGHKFVVTTSSGLKNLYQITQAVPLTIGGPLSVQLQWTPLPGPAYILHYFNNSYITSVLYYNGQLGTPSGTFVSGIQQYGANGAYQNITIPLVCILDSGYLDASLMISTYSFLYPGSGSNLFYCPYSYYSFVYSTLGISSIQLDSSLIRFAYSIQPQLTITYNNISLSTTGSSITGPAVLTCTSQGGYPPFVTTRWIQNGQTVTKGINMATIATGTQYGLYVCSVDNTVLVTQSSVLVEGEGNFQLELLYTNGKKCIDLSPFELNAAAISITSNITYILTSLCYCDVDEQHFKSSAATCASDGQVLLYTATLSYASTTGNVTGSTLAAQLLAWFLVQISPTLVTNDGVLRVYPALKTALQSPTVSSQAGPITGGFIGGLSFGVLMTALVASVSYYIYMKRMATKRSDADNPNLPVPPVRYAAREDIQKVQIDDFETPGFNKATFDDSSIYEPTPAYDDSVYN